MAGRERDLATAEPTRPAPTTRMNMSGSQRLRPVAGRARRRRAHFRPPVCGPRGDGHRLPRPGPAASCGTRRPARSGSRGTAPCAARTSWPRRRSCRAGRRGRRTARRRARARAPPRPARSPPPRAVSPPARSPRRRARARTVAVWTWTPSYSSPTAFARRSAARASSRRCSGRRASRGNDIGISKTQIASIVAPSSSSSPTPSSAASRPAVWTMSSSSGLPKIGTRITPYSASGASVCSAAAGDRHALEHRLVLDAPVDT